MLEAKIKEAEQLRSQCLFQLGVSTSSPQPALHCCNTYDRIERHGRGKMEVAVQREKLREINAVPAKEILKNKARVCK
jgi:hypothetical protein